MKKKKVLKIVIIVLLCLLALGSAAAAAVNARVVAVGKKFTVSADEAAEQGGFDCIIVLGCLVHSDGELSDMLRDRLDTAISLYEKGAAPKLLMSGDHGTDDYDEVNAMKKYATELGVPSEDVFMDHAGFSTYETVCRAKEVFGAKKVIIVTQQYHLYRALYIAERLGLEAYGVPSDLHTYAGQSKRDLREFLARNKDFIMCIFKPAPKYLGDPIPLTGSGDVTEG